MEAINVLNNDVLEQTVGGKCYPTEDELKDMGLGKYVKNRTGILGIYYDTWREETGTWKQVGAADMVKYVERTLGKDDERYKALIDYVEDDIPWGMGF